MAALGNGIDPCVNVPPFIAAYGNSAANPNRAKVQALCAGLTYASTGEIFWSSRLSTSLDYYRIKIKDAISFLTPVQSYQACFNANGLTNPTYDPNNFYCKAIQRSPWAVGGSNLNVLNTYQNQGGIQTEGIDVQADWGLPIGPGRFNLNTLANYLVNYKISVLPGTPFVDYKNSIDSGGVAYFRWRLLLTPSYNVGHASVGLRWKHLPQTNDVTCVASPTACSKPTDAYNLLDVFAGYELNDHVRFMAGVDNLLDKDPPVVGGTLGNTNLGEYDLVGRAYWAGVRIQFQ